DGGVNYYQINAGMVTTNNQLINPIASYNQYIDDLHGDFNNNNTLDICPTILNTNNNNN
ncbi:9860_t:CDS:1, partial [Entrophospora sp. SA101]